MALNQRGHCLVMSFSTTASIREAKTYLRGVILDCETCASAEQNEVIPIGAISPLADALLDLAHVIRDDPECGGFPLALCSEDGRQSINNLVGCGVRRGCVGDN